MGRHSCHLVALASTDAVALANAHGAPRSHATDAAAHAAAAEGAHPHHAMPGGWGGRILIMAALAARLFASHSDAKTSTSTASQLCATVTSFEPAVARCGCGAV